MLKTGFLSILLLISSAAYAEPEVLNAQEWLKQMQQAMSKLNYQGTVTFFRNNKLNTMKYFHAATNGIEQERLLSLNSPLREVIRDADRVSCILKDSQQVIVDHRPEHHSFIVNLPANFVSQDQVYKFSLAEVEQVAMQPAQVISITPKDEYRYRRKIWVHQQNFLPLKLEVYDANDAVLEQVMFTELNLTSALPFTELNLNDLNTKHIHESKSQSVDKMDFVLTKLPAGFEQVFFVCTQIHNTEQPVEHLLLSDGLAAISVYKENRAEMLSNELKSAGTVNSLVHIVDGVQFVVMGDVPVKAIQLIADGIQLKK